MNIEPGLHFQNIHMPNHDFFVKEVDLTFNKLTVHIRSKVNPDSYWTENDWNLEHTKSAFEKGEYFIEASETVSSDEIIKGSTKLLNELQYRSPNSRCKACEDEAAGIKHIRAQKHTCRKRRDYE